MAPSFLRGAGSRRSAKFFDVRLDDEYIVLRGHGQEAASAHLRGKVVLCLSAPLAIKHLTLTLTGISRIANPFTTTPKRVAREQEFFQKNWTFRDAGKGKSETLGADNYEFPFDVVLEGSLPESVEGLPESFVIYRFKATIARKHAKDVVVRKPLRIVRTLDSNALEWAHAMSVSNVWPNKLQYSISTPSKAVIYGTSIETEFRLVPLLKGLRIGSITTQVIETQEFSVESDEIRSVLSCHKYTRVVADDQFAVPEDPEILDEEAEGYRFSRHIELPKSLTRCLQDAETSGIKIKHKLKFNIQLHNPDDHTSELRATLPVSLYISPSLAMNENNELVDQSSVAARRAVQNDIAHLAPPVYGDHHLDQLYSDVDFSGYPTPTNGSSSGTPLGALSRNMSSENVSCSEPSLGGESAFPSNGTRPVDVSAAVLRTRLQNLRSRPTSVVNEGAANDHDLSPGLSRRGSVRNGTHGGEYLANNRPSRRSHSASSLYRSRSITAAGRSRSHSVRSVSSVFRRASDDSNVSASASGTQTPSGPQFSEIENLSRVPSYSIAVRALARTPYSGSSLPSYFDAITMPNSNLNPTPVLSSPSSPSNPAPGIVGAGQIAGPGPSALRRAVSNFTEREQRRLSRLGGSLGDDETRRRPGGPIAMPARGLA